MQQQNQQQQQQQIEQCHSRLIELRSNNQPDNLSHVHQIFTNHSSLLAPLESACPKIKILLSHLLTNETNVIANVKAFWRRKTGCNKTGKVTRAPRLHDLTDAEAATLGKSFRKFLLGNKETATAVIAWKLDNPILDPLFTELIFEPIIIAIAKELIKSSKVSE